MPSRTTPQSENQRPEEGGDDNHHNQRRFRGHHPKVDLDLFRIRERKPNQKARGESRGDHPRVALLRAAL